MAFNNKAVKLFLLGGALLCGAAAYCGEQEGKVTRILVRESDGLHYFFLSGSATNRPSCATNYPYWMIANENSRAGQSQFAMLMTAYVSGKSVRVTGTGRCDRWGDGEDVNTVQFLPG